MNTINDKAITKVVRKLGRAIAKDEEKLAIHKEKLVELSVKLSPEVKTRYNEKYFAKVKFKLA